MAELTHWEEDLGYYADGHTREYPSFDGKKIPQISLSDHDPNDTYNDGRVLCIGFGDGHVVFVEKCDSHYQIMKTPSDAITALEEAIAWIKEQANNYE